MEDIKDKKLKLRQEAKNRINAVTKPELAEKRARIEQQLFEFANFKEAQTIFFHVSQGPEVSTENIMQTCMQSGKNIVLPLFDKSAGKDPQLYRINSLDEDLQTGPEAPGRPDPRRCKPASFDSVDLAIVPGTAFDEKGGRLGSGSGRYDRLIPMLPNTARKVALAFEEQMFFQIPMEPHDKYMDIIITEKRIIYKI
ncbi:MAG: 5-formyltetrahydrofolate cyclo-ligase [Desulfobacterales bacterium]